MQYIVHEEPLKPAIYEIPTNENGHFTAINCKKKEKKSLKYFS